MTAVAVHILTCCFTADANLSSLVDVEGDILKTQTPNCFYLNISTHSW